MTPSEQTTEEACEDTALRYPALGIVPRTVLGKIFLLWAITNSILALLPVFNIYANSAEIGPLGMPVTVLYSYVVFSLNCIMGVAYFYTRGLNWVELMESKAGGR